MSILGNVLWIVLGGGIIIFFMYLFGGFLLCLTIVGIPFGWQCIKLSILALVPFGKEVTVKESAGGVLAIIMNVIWILFGGFWIAITHLLLAVLLAITVIGIPFAKQHIKLASLSLTPFGREIEEGD
ncbi:MAG: YccF domain-containing protein [Caldithrix sp.]|nr:MAG: YccF domain-containing protein [Caldithrix sp.]